MGYKRSEVAVKKFKNHYTTFFSIRLTIYYDPTFTALRRGPAKGAVLG
jgi:hypothetical protein